MSCGSGIVFRLVGWLVGKEGVKCFFLTRDEGRVARPHPPAHTYIPMPYIELQSMFWKLDMSTLARL